MPTVEFECYKNQIKLFWEENVERNAVRINGKLRAAASGRMWIRILHKNSVSSKSYRKSLRRSNSRGSGREFGSEMPNKNVKW